MRLPDNAVALIHAQHGVVSRRQLLRFASADAIDSQARRGSLVRVERGVYRSRFCPETPQQTAMAAVLRSGGGARLTGPFVLALHGVSGLGLTAPWEVLLPPGRRVSKVDFAHRRDPTPSDDPLRVDGLPVVSPVAALIDSARRQGLGARTLRLAYDSCRWKGLLRTADVLDRARCLGRRDAGAAVFLEWHARGELRPESDGERRLGALAGRFGPPPAPQVEVAGYRIDWFWHRYRFGLEYLGVTDHRSARDRLADTARLHTLLRQGVEIHGVTAEDLRDEEVLLTRIRRLLTTRAGELGLAPPAVL